jgi:hypothetical protein
MPIITGPSAAQVSYTFKVQVPRRIGLPKEQQRLGVGEQVILKYLGNSKSAQWKVASGAPATALVADTTQSSATATFTAPDVSQESQTSYKVVLQLKLHPTAPEFLAQVTFEVARPSGGRLEKVGEFHYRDANVATRKPNAGLFGMMHLVPDDVSFMNVVFQEGDGINTATGAFSNYNGDNHPASAADAWAQPMVVTALGTKFDAKDKVYSAAMQWSAANNTGEARCPIKWRYKLKGAANPGKLLGTVEHYARVDSAGTVTLTKGGAAVTKQLDDVDDPPPAPPAAAP